MAYNKTSKKKRYRTSDSANAQNLDETNMKKFKDISHKLKLSKYKVGASRRILNLKINPKEKHSVMIMSS